MNYSVNGQKYVYFSLPEAARRLGNIEALPFSLKILLENLLRHEDGQKVTKNDIQAVADWLKKRSSTHEIAYHPARVLMQDFTGSAGGSGFSRDAGRHGSIARRSRKN